MFLNLYQNTLILEPLLHLLLKDKNEYIRKTHFRHQEKRSLHISLKVETLDFLRYRHFDLHLIYR